MSWIETTKVECCSGYNAPPLRQSTTVALKVAVSDAFSKHVTHYGPQSGFSYYNLIIHIQRATTVHRLRCARVGLIPGTLTSTQSQYQNVGPLNNPVLVKTYLQYTPVIFALRITYISENNRPESNLGIYLDTDNERCFGSII